MQQIRTIMSIGGRNHLKPAPSRSTTAVQRLPSSRQSFLAFSILPEPPPGQRRLPRTLCPLPSCAPPLLCPLPCRVPSLPSAHLCPFTGAGAWQRNGGGSTAEHSTTEGAAAGGVLLTARCRTAADPQPWSRPTGTWPSARVLSFDGTPPCTFSRRFNRDKKGVPST